MNPNDTLGAPAFKTCTKCGEVKPLSDFTKDKRKKYGIGSYCKACMRARARQYGQDNAEQRKQYNRKWYRDNRDKAEFRINEIVRSRLYREQNQDKVRQQLLDSQERRGWRNDKARARTAVNRAVRNGHLPPAWSMVCDECKEAQAAHWHHHKGYERENWLDVIASCLDCHGKERRTE